MSRQQHGAVPDPSRSAVTQHDIDRMLRLRRMSQAKACYPCRQRKVKCDHGQPCQTCQKRRHPEICKYDLDAADSRRGRRQRTGSRIIEMPEQAEENSSDHSFSDVYMLPADQGLINELTPNAAGAPTRTQWSNCETPDESEPRTDVSRAGGSSVLALLDRAVQGSPGEMSQKAGPVLGLFNTLDISPFAKPKTPQELWAALLLIVPQQHELQK